MRHARCVGSPCGGSGGRAANSAGRLGRQYVANPWVLLTNENLSSRENRLPIEEVVA
jgi:hypothetical protein